MKTSRLKRIFFALALMLLGCYSAKAQITPSVYTGVGMAANLGGLVGIGTEVRYDFFSVNAAIGGAYFNSYENKEFIGDHPYLGYDVGIKCYFFKGLFGGVNYGVIDKEHRTTDAPNVREVEDVCAFSFTVGYKLNIYKGIYGMTYFGTTSDEAHNEFWGSFIPRIGLVFGYDFNLKSKK